MTPAPTKPRLPLTPTQEQVVATIRHLTARDGLAPTYQEIADHMDVSKVTVNEHVHALHRKGWLTRTRNARSIRLLGEACPACGGETERLRVALNMMKTVFGTRVIYPGGVRMSVAEYVAGMTGKDGR